LADQRSGSNNPFEQDGPTQYEQWNYIVGRAHGGILVDLHQKIDLLTEQFRLHEAGHAAANRAVLEMPEIKQSEKPS
jgi:hypothetical protein